ncbi:phage tail assembly chaperone [Pseudomonas sp. NPDC089554]|uniref:phage tail assembly chaperone n=1 Tax=Pseudomonas sp. NPDC089554 TaxID=3390653 RepID=UPI003D041B91
MQRFYSPSTCCSYLSSVHGSNMPADVVKIDEDTYWRVIASPPEGKIRAHDNAGQPLLIDAPAPDLAVLERSWRDGELRSVTWLRDRHRDQLDAGTPTTLNPELFAELLAYLQALRDWPQSETFPDPTQRPTAPEWITEHNQ